MLWPEKGGQKRVTTTSTNFRFRKHVLFLTLQIRMSNLVTGAEKGGAKSLPVNRSTLQIWHFARSPFAPLYRDVLRVFPEIDGFGLRRATFDAPRGLRGALQEAPLLGTLRKTMIPWPSWGPG